MRCANMMKWVAAAVIAVVLLATASARAQDLQTCCDLAVRSNGSCLAQSSPCTTSKEFAVGLSTLAGSESDDGSGDDASGQASGFRAGVDGYMFTTRRPPWSGLCLDAPSSQDPMHEGPTEPMGCIAVSLSPGESAQLADFQFPVSSMWDAYQLCFGAPSGPADAATPCANVNDLDDPTVNPTPMTGSCCGPVHVLDAQDSNGPYEWNVVVTSEIPGVPPPVLVLGPDGGLTVAYQADASDTLASVPASCLSAYGELSTCGGPPAASDAGLASSASACVPTTCAAQGAQCAVIPDGCGGSLTCTNCSTQGPLSCSAGPPGRRGGLIPGLVVLVAGIVAAAATRRRSFRDFAVRRAMTSGRFRDSMPAARNRSGSRRGRRSPSDPA